MKIQRNFNFIQAKVQNGSNSKLEKQKEHVSVNQSLYNSSNKISVGYFNPSFGLNNPNLALLRAQKIKSEYAKVGIPYLLPNEVWSNKRIFKTLEKVGQKYDELAKKNKLSGKNINKYLCSILPKNIAKKIKIKDFDDLYKDLLSQGYTKKEAEEVVNGYSGLTINQNDSIDIYTPLGKSNKDLLLKLDEKGTLQHELKHALTRSCSNIGFYEAYSAKMFPKKGYIDETLYYNDIFLKFEKIFKVIAYGEPVKLNKETMIQYIENTKRDKIFDTESELLEDMNNEIDIIINQKKGLINNGLEAIKVLNKYGFIDKETLDKISEYSMLTEEIVDDICKKHPTNSKFVKAIVDGYKLPDNAFTSKTFWENMQHSAMDEKQAYTTDSVYRKAYGNKKQPRDYELQSLVYGEMEKFFRQKVKEAKRVKG